MPIYKKASTADDVINGLVTVGGVCAVPKTFDPSPGGSGTYSQHWASGDALNLFVTLDGRYKVRPSGWSH